VAIKYFHFKSNMFSFWNYWTNFNNYNCDIFTNLYIAN